MEYVDLMNERTAMWTSQPIEEHSSRHSGSVAAIVSESLPMLWLRHMKLFGPGMEPSAVTKMSGSPNNAVTSMVVDWHEPSRAAGGSDR